MIDTKNTTPFLASWFVVTKGNAIVTGVMTSDVEIHPAGDRKRFADKAGADDARVVDEFVELRFRYTSLYAAELGNPPELSGCVRRAYRLAGGKVYDWVDPAVGASDSP